MKTDNKFLSLLSCLLLLILCSMFLPSCRGSASTVAEVESEIYRLVNEARHEAGLSELHRASSLDVLARQYSASELSEDVVQDSELHYLLRNSWWVVYSRGSPRLTDDTAREQVEYCLENEKLREVMLRSEARETGIGIAIIEKTLYFTQVFDVLNAASGTGEPIQLYENSGAANVPWHELQSFLYTDNTDDLPYITGVFVCADFAAMLHNRAEEMGIKTAYVSIDFSEGPAHALNAFNTTDRGLIYIDCTGPGFIGATVKDKSSIDGDYDKVAYIQADYEYGLIPLDRATEFDYEFYQLWLQLWDEYEEKVDLYNSGSLSYSELIILKKEIDELKGIIGDYHWEPLGIVTSVHLHW